MGSFCVDTFSNSGLASPTFLSLVRASSLGSLYRRARDSSLPSLRSGTSGESVLPSSKLVARCFSTIFLFVGTMSCMLILTQKNMQYMVIDYALTCLLPVVFAAWRDEDISTSFSSLALPPLNPLCHLPSRALAIHIHCCNHLEPVERHGETC